MRLFPNLALRHRLTLLSIVTSTVALLLTGAGIIVYEQFSFRKELVDDVAVTAQMIGYNSASALSFADSSSAAETLRALAAKPHIEAAIVYDKDGAVFATYPAGYHESSGPPPAGSREQFGRDHLQLYRPIVLLGEEIGTIYLRSDLGQMRERLRRYAWIIGGVMLLAMGVAYLIAMRLQRSISGPVSELATIVGHVGAERNYSVRAVKASNDELGRLIDGFNDMLGQIEARDRALWTANESLEKRVEERTGALQRENTERKQAEAGLASSLSVLHATLESTVDGILVVDAKGGATHFNRKFGEMWRVSRELMATGDNRQILPVAMAQLKNPRGFIEKVQQLYQQPEAESFDVLEFKDGRIFERYSQPQRIDGRCRGRVWSFRDITERKRAETELASIHRQLLDASRQAGMAEVATGVLHNVGNVLNSVNVSATLVMDYVRHSKAGGVAKLSALFEQHKANLGDFLVRDPRGQIVPGYLRTLAESLAAEQKTMLTELQHLRQNVEHIKDIVAMQQNYAKNSGFTETISLPDLIEDALRMNVSSMARHEIDLVRDYQARPVVTTDKHKVIQILINLVRNAKFACDESGRTDKRIVIRTTAGEGRAKIAVSDNGVGIPAENLTRIFAHGFTTRKEGHGFGLHSGALAAKEIGGAITVLSDGPGKGATFTLELPLMEQPLDLEQPNPGLQVADAR
jgi:PAS domain S-box-containing protein